MRTNTQIQRLFYAKRQSVNKERRARGLEPLRLENRGRATGPRRRAEGGPAG